ncbi:class I SAM-dependent methyltransferase [Sungkyunkwania multivorans]|uniref:Class I SAM-dependent methyltransferase n=1 Tax=Sungkyunkwania multivorans TaxID=1173618 RepID=A0ABW3D4Y2_9FLAO
MGTSKKYKNIASHYERCLEAYGDSHKGVDWPNEEDALKRYEVMLEVIKEKEKKVSVLDFGCGAAHLYQYIKDTDRTDQIAYTGSDISEKFISLSKKKFPGISFHQLDVLADDLKDFPSFDYLILNGVFTEKQDLSFEEMWDFFTKMLLAIYPLATKGIAFNVMSKAVDWEREDLFHVSTDKLIDFICENLSRNFVLRNDYGLYEYTVYLYK